MLLDENQDCEEEDDDNSCGGAGLWGEFKSTKELHVMKYKRAMKTPDKDNWTDAVFEEPERMVKRQVWRAENKKKRAKES
jgi:hypothetical protein